MKDSSGTRSKPESIKPCVLSGASKHTRKAANGIWHVKNPRNNFVGKIHVLIPSFSTTHEIVSWVVFSHKLHYRAAHEEQSKSQHSDSEQSNPSATLQRVSELDSIGGTRQHFSPIQRPHPRTTARRLADRKSR